MSVSPISPLFASKVEEQPIGCWQRFKDGVGWIVSKVIWLVITLGKIILWPIQIISTLAFKALGVVWPEFAARAEAYWGHLLLIGERVITAVREEELLGEIDQLQKENQNLREEVDAIRVSIEEAREVREEEALKSEAIREERDAAQRERDQKLEGRVRLTLERDQLKEALSTKEALTLEKNRALQEMEVMKQKLDQLDRNEALLEQFKKMESAPIDNAMELEKLVPLYERQKAVYGQMIRQVLNDLSPEHTLRVPLQGILGLFESEIAHLRRISKGIHFYTQIKGEW